MPWYPVIAVYSKVDSLSCSNVPCSGFCTMLEFAITPSILRGKRQAPPDATLKTPVELMPQVDSAPATGHSEAACADETDTKLGAARTIAKAIAFDTRMKNPSVSDFRRSRFSGATLIWIKETSDPTRTFRPSVACPLYPRFRCKIGPVSIAGLGHESRLAPFLASAGHIWDSCARQVTDERRTDRPS